MQWLRTTNTVWWRDFPQLKIRNYHALFHSSGVSKGDSVPSSTAGDFGAQLAYFVSCLLVDVPVMAHWVVGLAQYDFSGAEASLVVSIPGVHGSLCSSVHQNSMENLELVSLLFTSGLNLVSKPHSIQLYGPCIELDMFQIWYVT